MYPNLWMFLIVTMLVVGAFLYIAVTTTHKKKMKELEIEGLKIQKFNLEVEVEDAVNRKLGDQLSRIEILEAVVTDKNYELNEKISRLK